MYTRFTPALGVFFGLVLTDDRKQLFAQANADVVINQVYASGGDPGGIWRNDYVELFNRSTVTVDISTWALQYSPPVNTSWKAVALKGTLEPGQYFLVQFATYDGVTGSLLPQYDAKSGIINLNSTDGKLALTRTTTPLIGDPVGGTGTDIVDFLGYGVKATMYEGNGAALSPDSNNAIYRLENGLLDSGNNDADFMLMAANPRNTSSPFQPVPEPFTTGIITLAVAGGVILRNRFQKKKC